MGIIFFPNSSHRICIFHIQTRSFYVWFYISSSATPIIKFYVIIITCYIVVFQVELINYMLYIVAFQYSKVDQSTQCIERAPIDQTLCLWQKICTCSGVFVGGMGIITNHTFLPPERNWWPFFGKFLETKQKILIFPWLNFWKKKHPQNLGLHTPLYSVHMHIKHTSPTALV